MERYIGEEIMNIKVYILIAQDRDAFNDCDEQWNAFLNSPMQFIVCNNEYLIDNFPRHGIQNMLKLLQIITAFFAQIPI